MPDFSDLAPAGFRAELDKIQHRFTETVGDADTPITDVNHPRPSGDGGKLWFATVDPNNAADNDLVIRVDETDPEVVQSLADLSDVAVQDTAPGDPAAGDVWLDTAEHLWKRWDGAAWVTLGGGGNGGGVDPSAGPWFAARPFAGNYLRTAGAVLNNQPTSLGTMVAGRLFVRGPVTLDRVGLFVASSGAAVGNLMRLGIYSDDDGRPGALLVDAGTVDASTEGGKELTINVTVAGGTLWLAAAPQGDGATRWDTIHDPVLMVAAHQNTMSKDQRAAFARTGVSAGLPDPFAPTGVTATAPLMNVRVA